LRSKSTKLVAQRCQWHRCDLYSCVISPYIRSLGRVDWWKKTEVENLVSGPFNGGLINYLVPGFCRSSVHKLVGRSLLLQQSQLYHKLWLVCPYCCSCHSCTVLLIVVDLSWMPQSYYKLWLVCPSCCSCHSFTT
jgi:hypothetical protein